METIIDKLFPGQLEQRRCASLLHVKLFNSRPLLLAMPGRAHCARGSVRAEAAARAAVEEEQQATGACGAACTWDEAVPCANRASCQPAWVLTAVALLFTAPLPRELLMTSLNAPRVRMQLRRGARPLTHLCCGGCLQLVYPVSG